MLCIINLEKYSKKIFSFSLEEELVALSKRFDQFLRVRQSRQSFIRGGMVWEETVA